MPADNKVNLREYKNLIETIAKVEYQKFSVSHLIELPELINIGNHTLYLLFKNCFHIYFKVSLVFLNLF